jgi:hypothetical protein
LPWGRGSGVVLRCADSRQRGKAVAAERPTRARAGERAAKRSRAREAEATQPPPERRFVDVDPWAVLLEQLMEVPEEGSATSGPEQRGTNDQAEPRRSAKKGRGR